MSPDEHSARLETLGRRLSGSSKGLLEIGSGGRVTFLHRTLRDFLVRHENQEKVGNATRESDFDAHLQLCSALYCLMKAVAFSTWANSSPGDPTVTYHLTDAFQTPDSMSRGNQYVVMKWFTECLKSASRVTVGNHDMINVLDSLNNDLKALPRLRRQLSAEVALSTDSPVEQQGWFSWIGRLVEEESCSSTTTFFLWPHAMVSRITCGQKHSLRLATTAPTTHMLQTGLDCRSLSLGVQSRLSAMVGDISRRPSIPTLVSLIRLAPRCSRPSLVAMELRGN